MDDLGRLVIFAFVAWLVAVAAIMAFRPALALRGLRLFASTPAIHFGEMALRITVGLGMLMVAPASRLPLVLSTFGWLLIVTSLALCLAPRRWHHAYAIWWAERIPARAVALLSPVTLALAVGLACLVG